MSKLALAAWAAALAIFAGAHANAQTATSLDCNGCVTARQIGKNAVRNNNIANKAVSPSKLLAPTGAGGTGSVSKSLITENQTVTKIVVRLPKPGVVVVGASGFYRFHSNGARGACTITKGTITEDPRMLTTGGTAADDELQAFSGTRAFVEKKAGKKTYKLVCSPDGSDQVDVSEVVMTAIYAPTNILVP